MPTSAQLEGTSATGTTLSGDTVAVTAGQDIRVQGSNVVSDAGTSLAAAGNVTIESATNTLIGEVKNEQGYPFAGSMDGGAFYA